MKFSAQEEYGLRCLLAVARAPKGTTVTIPEIAEQEQLSEPHVAKLLMILRKDEYVKSVRGHSGGYALARPPEEMRIGDVLASLGGRLYAEGFCDRHSGLAHACVHESECAVQFLWSDIQEAVDAVVDSMTLKDLMERTPRPIRKIELNAAPTKDWRQRALKDLAEQAS